MQIDEIYDIMSTDVSGVELQQVGINYAYDFEYEDEVYRIDFRRKSALVAGGTQRVPVWLVLLEGPSGMSLTGEAGMGANIIYKHLLMACKKLLEIEDVKGFTFTPAQPRMAPMYELFYKKFLLPEPPQGAGFVRVTYSTYLRRDVIRDLASTGNKKELFQGILGSERRARQNIEKFEILRKDMKRLKRLLQSQGAAIAYSYLQPENLLAVYDADGFEAHSNLHALEMKPDGTHENTYVNIGELDFSRPIPTEKIELIMKKLKSYGYIKKI